ncbi:hypothetical protein [uncultured Fretibacterium sp.]|jgi:hypothetical protein|uniref:hypothetical protein n=1 Tax=uncultured Fretibacterium sp. TaxID=1678694 RepID=UPI00261D4075|nr:hypothetical protein [uncultured Fretibacterium sp.]
MDAPAFENLDLACARTGQAIAEKPSKELEKLVTSALAVLEEQGVYALFLFLKTRGGKAAPTIEQKVREFLKTTPQRAPLLSGDGDVFALLQSMSEDLDKLLLARDLLRQALVYARYHARVPQKSESRT